MQIQNCFFLCWYGTFEYQVIPLGLPNVHAIFQYLINSCFHDMLDEFITIYLDDLLIYSKIEAEHEVHLYQVPNLLYKETMFVKYRKCKFGKDSVEYLGHIVR